MDELYKDIDIDESEENETLFRKYVIVDNQELLKVDNLLKNAFCNFDAQDDI